MPRPRALAARLLALLGADAEDDPEVEFGARRLAEAIWIYEGGFLPDGEPVIGPGLRSLRLVPTGVGLPQGDEEALRRWCTALLARSSPEAEGITP